MRSGTRRSFLAVSVAAAAAGCAGMTAMTVSDYLQLVLNGLSAVAALVPANDAAVVASIDDALTQVRNALANPSVTTVGIVETAIDTLVSSALPLFPAGSPVGIALSAIVALVPTIVAFFPAPTARTFAAAGKLPAMTVADAVARLRAYPAAPR
jgi:hypothetical protein